ncbi:hypothetical protein [Bosea lathyri]|uniref:hypothetical protein n=1 Tax=Bosea lathyri TaxID=1036778 RepID=UPI0011AFD556|nr:hypothetical protein [Bosea lathyri]
MRGRAAKCRTLPGEALTRAASKSALGMLPPNPPRNPDRLPGRAADAAADHAVMISQLRKWPRQVTGGATTLFRSGVDLRGAGVILQYKNQPTAKKYELRRTTYKLNLCYYYLNLSKYIHLYLYLVHHFQIHESKFGNYLASHP